MLHCTLLILGWYKQVLTGFFRHCQSFCPALSYFLLSSMAPGGGAGPSYGRGFHYFKVSAASNQFGSFQFSMRLSGVRRLAAVVSKLFFIIFFIVCLILFCQDKQSVCGET